ncbi:MAG: hypothetical protein KUG79_10985 [Pseudomonadales bacterium]|nr:hypothetical protein [Pseudomonadales bacterium]
MPINSPLNGKPQLTIYLNFNGLASFLALQPTLNMLNSANLAGAEFDLTWLPFFGATKNKEPSNNSDQTLLENPEVLFKARRQLAKKAYETIELRRNCLSLGITEQQANARFNAVDVINANIGLLYLNAKGINPERYLQQVFQLVYAEGEKSVGMDGIMKLLFSTGANEAMGVNKDDFLRYQQQALAAVDDFQQMQLETGVFEAPAYRLHGERYMGRQHLPLISYYLLAGHRGGEN